MTDCYYELLEDDAPVGPARGQRLRPTAMAISTWTSAIQHGAPVSALLVRALERCAPRPDTRLSRVVVDLLRPVPMAESLWVTAQLERGGKQIELVGATLWAPGPDGSPRAVARASGWRLQTLDTAELGAAPTEPLPGREAGIDRELAGKWDPNYVHSVDWLWLKVPPHDGPGESWMRPRVALVDDEPLTPIQRLFTVADCANGLGSKLDIRRWTFMNTDMSVHLHRVPTGQWSGIRADTHYGPDGIGSTVGTLFDDQGPVGVIAQSVLVRPRPPKP